jgi:hypothetical protein
MPNRVKLKIIAKIQGGVNFQVALKQNQVK